MYKVISAYIVVILLQTNVAKSQTSTPIGMDVSIHGYIFLTENGLFYQPLDYYEPNKLFLSSVTRLSFKIQETNLIKYSEVLNGVGNKLIVKTYSEEVIKENKGLNALDTVFYFKCTIDISLIYANDETKIDSIGYGFFVNNSLLSFGNLYIRNQLLRIIPDEPKILKDLYYSYSKLKWSRPDWLEKLYGEKMKKSR